MVIDLNLRKFVIFLEFTGFFHFQRQFSSRMFGARSSAFYDGMTTSRLFSVLVRDWLKGRSSSKMWASDEVRFKGLESQPVSLRQWFLFSCSLSSNPFSQWELQSSKCDFNPIIP